MTKNTKNNHTNIIGKSYAITQLKSQALLAAKSNSRIMISGDSGVGKKLLAKFIHNNSPSKDKILSTWICTIKILI